MKIRPLIIRSALLLGATISLTVLPACTSPDQPAHPGPHQGNGVGDGKDGHDYKGQPAPHQVGTTGPHQGG